MYGHDRGWTCSRDAHEQVLALGDALGLTGPLQGGMVVGMNDMIKTDTSACPHHSSYNPAAGEPATEMYSSDPVKAFGCVHCLQARAQWLDRRLTTEIHLITGLDKRIAELEGQLAELEEAGRTMLRLHKKAEQQAEKREAVLVKALEEIAKAGPATRGGLLIARASAALEVVK